MPLPGDPALGLTGALTALQQQPPMTAAPNLQPTPGAGGEGAGQADLARAARSLESVQGNVAGQTTAISQMSMASQQQMMQVQTLMSQLDMRISGLSQALNQLSSSLQMSSMGAQQQTAAMAPMMMPAPQPLPPIPSPVMPAGTSFGAGMGQVASGVGRAGLGAGGMAMSALGGFGRFFGGLGGAAVAPFFGAQVNAPAAGQFAPSLGNAGFMRSAVLGTGLSIDPRMMRTAGAQQIAELGQERAGNRFADMGIAATGALGQLGAMGVGEGVAMGLGSAMGVGTLGGLGLSLGVGLPVAALGGLAVDQTMTQIANQRALGDQFARNAFRFMPPGEMRFQGLRRPGLMQRQEFGRGVAREGIEDLTFNAQDMAQIFATMNENDLMRGVRNTQQVIQRIRQGKETIKMMSRNLGVSIQEAGSMLGEMQGLGLDVFGQPGRTRAAIFGATSVPGMTREQAMRRLTQLASPFAGQGLGGQALGVAGLGVTGVQTGLQTGAISQQAAASFGGREGFQQFVTQAMMGMTQTQLGRATMLAGMQGGEFDPSRVAGLSTGQILSQASRNATRENMLELTQRPTQLMQRLMQNPGAATELLVRQALSIGQRLAPEADTNMKLRMGLKQHFAGMGMEVSDAQMSGFIEYLQSVPSAMRAQQREQGRSIAVDISNQAQEQAAIIPRIGREFERAFERPASSINRFFSSTGQDIADVTEAARRSILGLEATRMRGEMSTGVLQRIQGAGAGPLGEEIDVPSEGEIRAAQVEAFHAQRGDTSAAARARNLSVRRQTGLAQRAIVAARGASGREAAHDTARRVVNFSVASNRELLRDKVRKLRDLDDPNARRSAMRDILDMASSGQYSRLDPTSSVEDALMAEGIQRAVMAEFGVNPSAELTSGGRNARTRVLTTKEIEEAESAIKDAQDMLDNFAGINQDEVNALARAQEITQFLTGFAGGDPEAMDQARVLAESRGTGSQLEVIARGLQEMEQETGGSGRRVAGDIAAKMRKFARMDELRSGEKLITGLTGGVGQMLREEMAAGRMGSEGIGLEDLRGLSSQRGSVAMGALARLQLGPQALRALSARGPGGARAAEALSLRGGDIADMGDAQMQRVLQLVGDQAFADITRDGGIDENELGFIRSRALLEGGMTADLLTRRGEGITGQQGMSLLDSMASNNERLAASLEKLLPAIERIANREGGGG